MSKRVAVAVLTVLGVCGVCRGLQAQPFLGTIFIDPDIITSAVPTTFTGMEFVGTGDRLMCDRRVNRFITLNAYLFNASFSDGLSAEIQVSPEFGAVEAAAAQASDYAEAIGVLGRGMRR